MLERLQGISGKRLLVDTLLRQRIVNGNRELAEQIAAQAQLRLHPVGSRIVEQGAPDNDLHLILSGEVSIEVNGRALASRGPGQHLGEMALIDPTGRRVATAVARAETITATLTEPEVSALAEEHSSIWRLLAVELVERLRQRNKLVSAPNPEARVFIGSSREGLSIAKEIQSGLAHERAIVEIWTQRVFGASQATIGSLEAKAKATDFAVLVLSPDDVAQIREEREVIPRDNVVFESGLFMGVLGRGRTYMIGPRGSDIKLPTDLLGVTTLDYREGNDIDISARLGPVCTQIGKCIRMIGSKLEDSSGASR